MRIKSLEWLWKKASLRATPPFGGAARSHATWYLVYFNAATSWWYPKLKMPRKFTSKVTTQVCPFILLNIIKHKLELSTGNYSKSELNTLDIPWIRKGLNGKKKKTRKKNLYTRKKVEVRGFEPRTFRMQSGRSTTELHPREVTGTGNLDVWWIFLKPKFISQHAHRSLF